MHCCWSADSASAGENNELSKCRCDAHGSHVRSLTSRHLKQFSQALLCVHRTRCADEFSTNLLEAMRNIMAADICAVDWYGFRGIDVTTQYDPIDAVPMQVNMALHEFAHQNPVYSQSEGTACTISDLLSRAEWQRTDLYREGFRRVEQEDGMFMNLQLQPDCRVSLITSRGRRGYREEERAMFTLLKEHVQDVFLRLKHQHQLHQELKASAADVDLPAIPVSAREREVLHWLSEGKSNAEIAILLGISPGTVKKHLENIYNKLGVGNRHAASLLVLRLQPGLRHDVSGGG